MRRIYPLLPCALVLFAAAGLAQQDTSPAPVAVADIAISDTHVYFGDLASGQSAETTLQIRNIGDADLHLRPITVDGSQFDAYPLGALTVPAGGKLPVALSFRPHLGGQAQAVLLIQSDDPDEGTIAIKLTGEGAKGPPPGLPPTINAGGVVDSGGFRPLLAPGGIGSLFGTNLAGIIASAVGVPLPTAIAGTRLEANGVPCPLFFISPTQINFQLPFETATKTSSAEMVVFRDGVASDPVTVAVDSFAPGLYVNAATSEPIIQRHPDGALITAANPARPGDVLIIYLTGIGGLDVTPPTGTAASASPLSFSLVTPSATLDGMPANVIFAGLTPGQVGLAQINAVLPVQAALAAARGNGSRAKGQGGGTTLPMLVRFGDRESQLVNIPVAGLVPPTGAIEITPGSLDFGSVDLNNTRDLPVNIRNRGQGPLAITGLTSGNPQFLQLAAQIPFTVQPGEQQAVMVRFQPTQAGSQSTTLAVASDDLSNAVINVGLSGTGVEPPALTPNITVDPTSVDFGGVNLLQSGTETFMVGNDGQGNLVVIAMTTDDRQFEAISPALPFTVQPGSQQTVQVRYRPENTNRVHMASLSISSNDPDQQLTSVEMEGFGRLDRADFNFGGVVPGRTRAISTFLTNNSGTDLEVTSIRSTSNQFKIVIGSTAISPGTPRTPFRVNSGENFLLKVLFAPTSFGVKTGLVRITTRGPGNPVFVLTLEGEGLML